MESRIEPDQLYVAHLFLEMGFLLTENSAAAVVAPTAVSTAVPTAAAVIPAAVSAAIAPAAAVIPAAISAAIAPAAAADEKKNDNQNPTAIVATHIEATSFCLMYAIICRRKRVCYTRSKRLN